MSVESRIKSALSPIVAAVEVNAYKDKSDTYITFNVGNVPTDYGDDEPQHEKHLVQVHLFCPHTLNTVDLRKSIKLALKQAGFTYPSETPASNEEQQHMVFECQDAGGVNCGDV